MKIKRSIILASSSSTRIAILKSLNLNFKVVPTWSKEYTVKNYSEIRILVKENAKLKINNFLVKWNKRQFGKIIITADTLVRVNQKIQGKPKNNREAWKMFLEYRQANIEIYTALGLFNPLRNSLKVGVEKSSIRLNQYDLVSYKKVFQRVVSLESAGGFSIEGLGAVLFDNLRGSFYNVLGLPIHLLFRLFFKHGLNFFDFIKK